MKAKLLLHCMAATLAACFLVSAATTAPAVEKIGYHAVRLDKSGRILPWYADTPSVAYDHVLNLLWFYWHHVPAYWNVEIGQKPQGAIDLPKYMVFRTLETAGIGGDQFAMMLSSWSLYYQYSGDPDVLKNMIYQADAYLDHGLSSVSAAWPNIPFPGNTEKRLNYDGDLILGKGVTQPDKAASFAAELVTLYKITANRRYLDSATKIADVLAAKIKPGDERHSPLPFKVVADTGEVKSPYTTNWIGALRLFQSLEEMSVGDTGKYKNGFNVLLSWLKQYPMQNNRWGPFFEDIPGWSDTEINAGTLAWYLLENKSWDTNWKQDVRRIQDWVTTTLGNHSLENLGVVTVNEQTAYKVPGQSHSSRHASIELKYALETGDHTNKDMAIRQLNWTTYAVDDDGKSKYPDPNTYEIWWTDGYGDYVRHVLRSMAAAPELAPSNQNHLLQTSSVVRAIRYEPKRITYSKFDAKSHDLLKIGAGTPKSIAGGTMKWSNEDRVLRVEADSPDVTIVLE
jgi:hypothetical protein